MIAWAETERRRPAITKPGLPMANSNWRDAWVGTATIVVAVCLIVFLARPAPEDQKAAENNLILVAEFGRIDGLHIDSPVRLAGIDVGHVGAIALGENRRATVTLSIANPDLPIPADTAAVIETDGIFGEKYVELHPGGDFEVLSHGQRISYAQDSVVLESLLNQVVSRAKASKAASEDEAP
jgi:phospholipid/cholesterol/gamma-HCH transport system substrate-binding protein